MSEYMQKLYEIEDVSSADELVVGDVRQCEIGCVELAGPAYLKRGTLLMGTNGEFVPASTSAASADELCILAEDADILEGEEFQFTAYFGGTFKCSAVILPYEGEEDSHEELLRALEVKLRQQKIRIL